jgi:hypothetical protein
MYGVKFARITSGSRRNLWGNVNRADMSTGNFRKLRFSAEVFVCVCDLAEFAIAPLQASLWHAEKK